MSVATVHRCSGCGAEGERQEEGRCAFCRMEDRGDDQLLAHDSRGYLDVDGKTRIPCGCGCGKAPVLDVPRDPLLDVVRDIVGHGQQVPIRLPEMPVKWRAEWIERLGGVIVIDPDAVMPLAMQRDKGNGGREALDAMDRGEPQRAERSETVSDTCKIEGCEEPIVQRMGRWAKLCARHKEENKAAARAEGSLGTKRPPPLPATDLEPVAPPPLPAPRDPDKVDVFDLLGSVVTPELIAWHEDEAKRHLLKVKALRAIREQLEAVG